MKNFEHFTYIVNIKLLHLISKGDVMKNRKLNILGYQFFKHPIFVECCTAAAITVCHFTAALHT